MTDTKTARDEWFERAVADSFRVKALEDMSHPAVRARKETMGVEKAMSFDIQVMAFLAHIAPDAECADLLIDVHPLDGELGYPRELLPSVRDLAKCLTRIAMRHMPTYAEGDQMDFLNFVEALRKDDKCGMAALMEFHREMAEEDPTPLQVVDGAHNLLASQFSKS